MKFSLKNPLTRFLVLAFSLYILWYLVYELWLHPIGKIDLFVIDNLNFFSSNLLQLFGFELIPEIPNNEDIRTIGIDGTHGLWIGDPCNGISLFALFIGFVLAYPGPVKRKLWYIPFGIITIHILNILRIAALSLILFYAPDYLDFNHTYTFTILVYAFVFLLWYKWATKYSRRNA